MSTPVFAAALLLGLLVRAAALLFLPDIGLPAASPGWPLYFPALGAAAHRWPALVAGAILSLVAWRACEQRTGRRDLAQWAALAIWLNPALVIGGEGHGLAEAWTVTPAVMALLLVHSGAYFAGGVVAAVGLLSGPHVVWLLSSVLVAALALRGESGGLRVSAGVVMTGALLLLAPGLTGGVSVAWATARTSWPGRELAVADAMSVWAPLAWAWHFVTWPRALTFRRLVMPHWITSHRVGIAAAAVLLVRACWNAVRTPALALHAALGAFWVLAVVTLVPGVPAHAALLALPLLAIAGSLRPSFRPILYTESTIVSLALMTIALGARAAALRVPHLPVALDVPLLLGIASAVVLVWMAATIGDEARARG